ncbi:MAG: DNA cytosine methyltransferase [Candidatus Heimdallarchaeota archaeon]|nr:DNA cytosine methyltransferase [Candidatus Heimdallarchaeota archaeon]
MMKIVDLFCGGGGYAYGFLMANPIFEVIFAIDIDYRAIETYKHNIPTTHTLIEDIRNVHSTDILKCTGEKEPDVIIASPPCESFSSANPGRMRREYDQLYSDEIGRLFLEAIRIIIDLEPDYFFIENVAQIASFEMKKLVKYEFKRSKYKKIYFNILRAENFGVPSIRKRVFVSNIEIPQKPSQRTSKTSQEAFESLQTDRFIANHEIMPSPKNFERKIPHLPSGVALVYFKGSGRKTYRNFVRLEKNKPSPTVMGKSRFIHFEEHRICTVREHARLMGYPDTFEFLGSIESQYNQVGESVPPILSEYIAQRILLALNN